MVLHERTRDELRETLGDDFARVHFVRDTGLDRMLHRVSSWLPTRVGENTFGFVLQATTQLRQRRLLLELVRRKGVNVVHEPSPVSPKRPSLVFGLGVPVVVGPMNGGMSYPRTFAHLERRGEGVFVAWARRATRLMNRVLPGKQRATVLLVANQRTRRALPVHDRGQVVELVENAVDLAVFAGSGEHQQRVENATTRLVFSGRLVAWKGLPLLLEALARLERSDVELRILGDGEQRQELEALVARLGLSERVAFLGFLPQRRCAEELGQADVLVLPSVYECGGAVVLEAMAMGLPVIAHRWGGPADYLDEQCGILLDPELPLDQLIDAWAAAIRSLVEVPERRAALGRVGREKVRREFTWPSKIEQISAIYARARAEWAAGANGAAARSERLQPVE
ncbi:MAG TPA: glycosyltransferase family 4 protein [Polyangiaceae bacterium]|nr:glycosyltransferase family 4 protein [Polyangiaceae bacterium]